MLVLFFCISKDISRYRSINSVRHCLNFETIELLSSAFVGYEELCSLEGCYRKVKSRDYQESIKLYPLLRLPKKGKVVSNVARASSTISRLGTSDI